MGREAGTELSTSPRATGEGEKNCACQEINRRRESFKFEVVGSLDHRGVRSRDPIDHGDRRKSNLGSNIRDWSARESPGQWNTKGRSITQQDDSGRESGNLAV